MDLQSVYLSNMMDACDNSTQHIPLCRLHQMWREYGPASYPLHATIGVFMFIIMMGAVTGNGLVLMIYSKFRSFRTDANFLIASLAVCDLGMALCNFPLYILSSFNGSWLFSDKVCEFYGFSGSLFGLASINCLAAIAYNRCQVIVHAKTHKNKQRKNKQIIYGSLVVTWLYALCWSIAPILGWNSYVYEGFGTHCSFDYLNTSWKSRSFIVSIFVGGFMVPLMVILSCYTYIFSYIWRNKRYLEKISDNPDCQLEILRLGKSKRRQRTEMKTAKSILLVIALYCISWMPYALVSLVGVFGDQRLISPILATIPGIFAKASTVYNPIVYAMCLPKFKNRVRKLALHVCCGIKGLQMVTTSRSKEQSIISQTQTSGIYRKPAVRARNRSEYLISYSNVSQASEYVVRYQKKDNGVQL